VDTNTKTTSARSTSADATQQLRDMAETGAKQSKEAFEKMGAATTDAAEAMTNCCSTAFKGMQDYNSKLAEFTHANTKSNLEFIQSLVGVKSPSEFVQVSTEHARHQLETMAEQSKQLAALTQHVTLTTAEPFKTGFAKASVVPEQRRIEL
jgi:phasin